MEGLELSGRSTLVTGAYGLLGSWLTRALVESDARVTVVRRDQTVSALVLEGIEQRVNVVHGDVCDPALMERALTDYDVDTVFHLAAQTLVGKAVASPVSTFEANVRGTWTVLEACRLRGVQRVVVAASDKVYGASAELPYREGTPLLARYPYDVSKAAADLIARSYWSTYRLPVAVTRFANLYGGGDLNPSRLIPETVTAALSGRRPIIRSDGTPERDYLYVEDAVSAYLAIAEALSDGERACGEPFNAGSGRGHSVLEVVALVCRAAGADVEPDVRGRAELPGEIDRQWVDSSKLRELTGWTPRVGLEEGLSRTVDWYRRHPQALAQG